MCTGCTAFPFTLIKMECYPSSNKSKFASLPLQRLFSDTKHFSVLFSLILILWLKRSVFSSIPLEPTRMTSLYEGLLSNLCWIGYMWKLLKWNKGVTLFSKHIALSLEGFRTYQVWSEATNFVLLCSIWSNQWEAIDYGPMPITSLILADCFNKLCACTSYMAFASPVQYTCSLKRHQAMKL